MDCLTLGEPLLCFDSGEQPLDAAPTVLTSAVGAEGNVAIGLARLGRSAGYVGRVGRDSAGRMIRRTLRGEGVDTALLRTVDDGATGILIKEGVGPGRVEVTYHRAGSAGSTLCPADLPASFDGIRRLHVTGITLVISRSAREAALTAMRAARAAGARVSLDANFRLKLAPAHELLRAFGEAAPLADEIFLGYREAALAGDPAAFAQSLPADVVILKQPRGGAVAYVGDDTHELPARPVPVVDPVGSGDGFAVGYLDASLGGADIDAALAAGAEVAARVISRRGDYHGLPYADEQPLGLDAAVIR